VCCRVLCSCCLVFVLLLVVYRVWVCISWVWIVIVGLILWLLVRWFVMVCVLLGCFEVRVVRVILRWCFGLVLFSWVRIVMVLFGCLVVSSVVVFLCMIRMCVIEVFDSCVIVLCMLMMVFRVLEGLFVESFEWYSSRFSSMCSEGLCWMVIELDVWFRCVRSVVVLFSFYVMVVVVR